MAVLRLLATALVGVAVAVQSALAHSTQRNPLNYATLLQDPVIETPGRHVHAYSHFDLSFYLHDRQQKIRLSLEPNLDVLHDAAQVHYLNADGTTRAIEPIDRSEHKVFKGHTFVQHQGHDEWTNVGWARIVVHRDGRLPIFEGAFRVDGDHHHVQTGDNYRELKHAEDPEVKAGDLPEDEYMVVWRDSDIVRDYGHDELKRDIYGRSSCSSDTLTFNSEYRGVDARDVGLHAVSARSLFGRDAIDAPTGNNGAGVNLVSTIGNTAGCPSTRKVALVGIATDCTYTASFNSSQAVRTNIIKQINAASQVYESTFNISLGIMNLTINEGSCPGTPSAAVPWNIGCQPGVTITDRLNLFSAWRGLSKDSNAYWTLLSTCNTDAAVGLAWLGQVCVPGAQTAQVEGGANETIAAANVVIKTPTEWQVIAHETGHTFGAVHDCVEPTCRDNSVSLQKCCPLSANQCDAGGQFIMNPSTGSGIKAFSPCSIGNICSAIGRSAVKIGCLTNNKDVGTITGSQCGNGIVEQGEDCDCGGPQGCGANRCCDPTTCKFTANAVCDPSNEDCCTRECQFAAAGSVCRASTGFCDPQETCTGSSPMCPKDVHQDDGTQCDSARGLSCASGQCTSRDLQCKTMIGARTTNNDTYACSSQGCQLSCASPQFGPNMCVTMNQNFLDGTPCQGGGRCSNGQCAGSSVANEISGWLNDNKNIVIPVASVVGGLILLALLSCCVSTIRRRKARSRRRANAAAKAAPQQMGSWSSYGGSWGPQGPPRAPIPMPPQAAAGRGPPPQYTPGPRPAPGQWNSYQQGRSMRYA